MSPLEARVIAANRVYSYANETYEILMRIFKPFIGQKIRKKGQALTEKVKNSFGDFEFPKADNYLSVYQLDSKYSLGITIRGGQKASDDRIYWHECTLYIGEMTDEVILASLNDKFVKFKTTYVAHEIELLRKDYVEKQKQLDKAREALYPFGDVDR